MAIPIENTTTNTMAVFSSPKSSTTGTQLPPTLEKTVKTASTQPVMDDVKVSEQGKALAYARMHPAEGNSGDWRTASLAGLTSKAAANLQKYGGQLAEQAASKNTSSEERAKLNESIMVVNSALEGMGQEQVPNTAGAAGSTPGAKTLAGNIMSKTNQIKQVIDAMKNFSVNTGTKGGISIVV